MLTDSAHALIGRVTVDIAVPARGVETFETVAGGVYEIHPAGSTQRR